MLALPRPYRTAVHLYYVEGYSVAEVAASWGAKEGTVKSWLSRGRVKLAAMGLSIDTLTPEQEEYLNGWKADVKSLSGSIQFRLFVY